MKRLGLLLLSLIFSLTFQGMLFSADTAPSKGMKWKPKAAKKKKTAVSTMDQKKKAKVKAKSSKIKLHKQRKVIKRTGPGPVA